MVCEAHIRRQRSQSASRRRRSGRGWCRQTPSTAAVTWASKATGFGSEPKPNPSSSAFLENPLDPNPRFQRFPREPVGSEPAVPPVFFRVRVLEPGWDCRPPHLNTTTLLPTGSTWHPCTTDQGTAGACLSRTERAELKRAPCFCALWAFLYLSTLPSYMCFTAVYCTCTRGPVRNRNRTRVPALSLRTRWIRTRGSSAFLENPLDPNPRFHG